MQAIPNGAPVAPTDRTTRHQVLSAGLRIADRSGPEAITIRAVAGEVGLTPMALYHHVRDRRDLVSGIVEQLLDEMADPWDGPGPWTERLRSLFLQLRHLGHQHPRIAPLVLHDNRHSGAMRRIELAGLQALSDAGVPSDHLPRVQAMVWTMQLAFVVREALGHFRDQPPGGGDRHAAAALVLVEQYVTWAVAYPERAFPDDPATQWSRSWDDD